MHTITVDDESLAVSAMLRALKKTDPDGNHVGVYRVRDFNDYIDDNRDIDIAFIDVDMSTDGISLTKRLREKAPLTNVVIYSGHPEYKADALDQYVSGFIVKPVSDEKLASVLANLRHPIREKYCLEPLKVLTFGNFKVYQSKGRLMTFTLSKSMEVFAYLIDRCGYPVTSRDIAYDVFEKTDFDKQMSKNISKYVISMIRDLEEAGYGDAVIKQNKTIKINKNRISCDLYDALEGDITAPAAFKGEYMIDYSWAEYSDTRKSLEERM